VVELGARRAWQFKAWPVRGPRRHRLKRRRVRHSCRCFPLQRLERLRRVDSATFPSRALPLVGLSSSTEVFSRPRSTPWLRVLPPCPFLSRVRTSRCFATGPPSRTCPTPRCRDASRPLPSLGPRRALSWGSTPLQSATGVHCPSGFRRLSRRLAPALGSASPGVLRPYDVWLRVPRFCHGRLDRPRETRATAPSPGSALGLRPLDRAHLAVHSIGLPWPLGGLSRADSCKLGFPRSRSSVVATPLSFRSRLPDRDTSLGFALQSFPFPRSRAAFRRPSASLRVRRRPCLRREDSWLSDRFPPRASS